MAQKPDHEVTQFADMLAAMGAEPRLRIVRLLLEAHPRGLIAGDIATELNITASTLSHHLDRLKREGVVNVRRDGTFLWYTANTTRRSRTCIKFLFAECCTRSRANQPRPIDVHQELQSRADGMTDYRNRPRALRGSRAARGPRRALRRCGCGTGTAAACWDPITSKPVRRSGEGSGFPRAGGPGIARLRKPDRVGRAPAGETVLDSGSGGGIDVLLSAERVGPAGKVYGLDMTDEMLALARENQRAFVGAAERRIPEG